MTDSHDRPVLSALLTRRSVRPRRLQQPGPDADSLDRIVSAGLRGIDHGGLRPWRLLLIDDRQRLGDAFAAIAASQRPGADTERQDRARERALAGPVLLAVIACLQADHAEVPEREQWIAIGAALQQMLLAADALGFAGSVLSGRKTEAIALHRTLELTDREQLVGFLTLGTPAEPQRPPPPALDPRARWSRWP